MKKKLLITAGCILVVVLLRVILEPKDHPLPFHEFRPSDVDLARAELSGSLLDVKALAALMQSRRLLLVGESHFVREPQRYLTTLLEQLHDSSVVLLLELSQDSQEDIDSYMKSGNDGQLAPVWQKNYNLPYAYIMKWAFANKSRVQKVIAFDQNFLRVGLNRLFLTDTRNRTMSDAILEAYEQYPAARIVAYGGQMHMTMAGRYRLDRENRSPAGARLLLAGIPRPEIFSVMLDGRGRFPLDSIWKMSGAVATSGSMGKLPYEYYINYPVFGVRQAAELFDAFVNLGELTEITGKGE